MSSVNVKELRKKRADKARAELERNGISIAQWALAHGFNTNLVYEILRGERECVRGDSHRIAVMLGLKEGAITRPQDFRINAKAA